MRRLSFPMLIVLLASTALAQDKFETVKVTGSVQLPSGATAPAKFRVTVEIARIEPGQVITFHKVVGRTEIGNANSFPVAFTVGCPKSVMKDTPANMFTLRAKVYDTTKGTKLIYETPMNEGLQPFTASMEPKQGVTLPVKAVAAK